MPLIVAGLRVAGVSTIGLVTITGAIGDRFGGLGFFIFEGWRHFFPTEMLFGAVPAMLLAVAVDLPLVGVQRRMTPWSRRRTRRRRASAGDRTSTSARRRAPAAARSRHDGHPCDLAETIAWLTDPANWSGPNGIPVRLAEHLALSLAGLLIACAIALPIGLWVGHTRRGGQARRQRRQHRPRDPVARRDRHRPADHRAARPAARVQGAAHPHRDGRPRDPADPRQRVRGDRRGRRRPHRGGARHGPAGRQVLRGAGGPAGARGDRRRHRARRPSRSSRRRRSGRSSASAASARTSSRASRRATTG